jgi:hypothetical protein
MMADLFDIATVGILSRRLRARKHLPLSAAISFRRYSGPSSFMGFANELKHDSWGAFLKEAFEGILRVDGCEDRIVSTAMP